MTEAEWLACRLPGKMLRGRHAQRMGSRKLRLLACACCRRVWHLLSEAGRQGAEVSERYADGLATAEELAAARPPIVQGGNVADNSMYFAAAPNRFLRTWAARGLAFAAWAVAEDGPNHEAEQA